VDPAAWLARLRHDLVKRLLWPARDRRDLGGAPKPGELVPSLIDGEGWPIAAAALWQALRALAPKGIELDAFDAALTRALAAAEADDVAGVLAFEAEVEALEQRVLALARSLEGDA
jgi:hypothetical protein